MHNVEKEFGGITIHKRNEKILVKKIVNHKILKNLNRIFKIHEEHRDSIDTPKNFIILATSKHCINQVMKHKSKDIFGIQGHPEYSGKDGRIILKNFLSFD